VQQLNFSLVVGLVLCHIRLNLLQHGHALCNCGAAAESKHAQRLNHASHPSDRMEAAFA